MRYFKVVTELIPDKKYCSAYAEGEYRKTYRPDKWTVVSRSLKSKGFGLCVYAFPNKTKDDEVLTSLIMDVSSALGYVREIWEVEVEEKMELPSKRLNTLWFDTLVKRLFSTLENSTYKVDNFWPKRTEMYARVKLVRKIGWHCTF